VWCGWRLKNQKDAKCARMNGCENVFQVKGIGNAEK
jgi:hypothetical protein